jgi:glycerophosphoryl diester phosphodiesterase
MTLSIAHRGDPHRHLENTIPAVAAAVEQGADLVEVDVALTRDGTVVLVHDRTLTRLWARDLAVADASFAEIRHIRSGGDGQYEIAEFEQVMRLLMATGSGLMADLPVPAAAEPTVEIVEKYDAFDWTVFAGDLHSLLRVRRRCSHARIALSWYSADRPSPELLAALRPEFYNPHWALLNQAVVDDMHERGLRVSTWTVDSPTNMVRLLQMNVDALITNRLRQFLAVRAAQGRGIYLADPGVTRGSRGVC